MFCEANHKNQTKTLHVISTSIIFQRFFCFFAAPHDSTDYRRQLSLISDSLSYLLFQNEFLLDLARSSGVSFFLFSEILLSIASSHAIRTAGAFALQFSAAITLMV